MEMSGSQTTQRKAANREAWVGDVETEWAEPISEEAKQWFSQHLEEKLRLYHGGRLTQKAAVALTIKDRLMQRYVISEGLQMRASDVAWAWVAQQVRDGRGAQGGTVFRPELGRWWTPKGRCCGSWWHMRGQGGMSGSGD